MRRLAILFLLTSAAATPATPTLAADEPSFTRQEDVIYGRKYGTSLTLDVFRPTKGANGLGVIQVVSGGWFSSHEGINRGFITPMTDRGYTVFAVVHGSQPRFTIPEILADMNRAVRFIRHHSKEYGIDPDRLGICGASAGGHLSLMQGTAGDPGNPSAADPVDRQPSRVAAVACFFPPTDFLNYGKPGVDAIGRGPLKDYKAPFDFQQVDPKTKAFVAITDEAKIVEIGRAISPIHHVSADDPPTLIVHGDADTLVPIQQAEIIVEKLKSAGVEAKVIAKPGAGHGWVGIDKDIATFADWFDEHLKKTATPKAAVIPSDHAKEHIGEIATIEMTVRASKDSANRREHYLDSEADYHDEKNFTIVVAYDHLDKFRASGIDSPAEHFRGKTIRVTGPLIRETEQVRIRVEDPSQIKAVE